ncbi:calmodulin-like protein 4 isoform X6 [Hyla sarda]|uniref:calmodulin-like protein 4 isoform X6 n=1 Tax=Hyla sarda TaxID=327740 RepID=UPI0024C3F124|nr:calmodulin-like protein 4 isoform X6 [Hyla sarda]
MTIEEVWPDIHLPVWTLTFHSGQEAGTAQRTEMTKFLSQDDIQKFKECFNLYDKKGKGKDGELEFSTFLTIMYRQQKQEDPENEILVAMLMTDRQKKGLIPLAELKAKLCRMGEKLTPEEVDDLFRDAEVGPDGMVKYEDFVRKMTLPLPDY